MNKSRLKFICKVHTGGTPKSSKEDFWGNDLIWYTPEDIGKSNKVLTDSKRKITYSGSDSSSAKIIKAPAIVMTTRAPVGNLGISYVDFTTNQGCKSLTLLKDGNINYVYYQLTLMKDWLNTISTGTTFLELSTSKLKDVEIYYPIIETQNIICFYLNVKLSEIDLLIFLKEKQIKLLEEQRQSMITEAVTKGLNPNVKMKDSGVEWIGEIPEHWGIYSLKRVLNIRNGKEIDSDSEIEEAEGSIPVYGSGGIFKWTNRKLYRGDSILFGRKGTIGKPIRVNGDFWTVDTMYYSIPKMKEASGYLFYLLCIYPWKLISTNTAVPSIVGTELGEQKICFPNSKQELRSIEMFLKNKDSEIKKLVLRIELQLVKLKEYRQSLIHEAVTGKIPIEEMESYLKEAEKDDN
ncbi:restriction endonuclease subunit S [Listeria goaensis]|uniref:restriction endonuclease subunit S n=1 Tax=Listeria goaensis TaxID=1649188 RepID=UPI000B58CAD2|nr:restriction endonuclease subunit S [Listeria goaensis]